MAATIGATTKRCTAGFMEGKSSLYVALCLLQTIRDLISGSMVHRGLAREGVRTRTVVAIKHVHLKIKRGGRGTGGGCRGRVSRGHNIHSSTGKAGLGVL